MIDVINSLASSVASGAAGGTLAVLIGLPWIIFIFPAFLLAFLSSLFAGAGALYLIDSFTLAKNST